MFIGTVLFFPLDVFLTFVWICLQVTFTLYILTLTPLGWIYHQVRNLRYLSSRKRKDALDMLRRTLKLLPKHLSLAVDSDRVSTEILANAVVWAVRCGIPIVTLYDVDGVIKMHREELGKLIEERKFEDDNFEVDFRTYSGSEVDTPFQFQISPEQNGSGDGDSKGNVVTVNLLSLEDAMSDLVLTTRRYCMTIADEEVRGKEREELRLDALMGNLEINPGQPDPDLLVKNGRLFTLDGFPPMLLRLTEIW